MKTKQECEKYNKEKYKKEEIDGNLSVIIPSHNRAHLIDFNLPTIYKQPFGNEYEIIVIDDRSTDNCREVVEKHNKLCGGRIRYIRLDKDIISQPKFGLEAPKYPGTYRTGLKPINVGIRHAKYGLIMQSDPEIFHLRCNMQKFVDKARNSYYFDWIWMGSMGAVKVQGDGQREREGLRAATEEFFKKDIKYKFDSSGYIENYTGIQEWLVAKDFEVGPCMFPICVCFSKEPISLIRGYDEEMIGYGWADNDILGRLSNIGVLIDGCMEGVLSWIHLYHECREIPMGGYNQPYATTKESLIPEDEKFTIEANRRNDEKWGYIE